MVNRWWAAPGAAVAVALLAACGSTASTASSSSGSAGSSSSSSSAGKASTTSATGIKTVSAAGKTVLVNSAGRTLYWFAIDTPTSSKCTGSCAKFWPPVIGKPTMAAGTTLSGKFGTIKRANGQLQATYLGHPLYTFVEDTKAGTDKGNGQKLSGGLWWAMTSTGAKIPVASASSTTGGSTAGGYGY